ncbi:beta-1,3-galactosyl-O-glycosyl-glycoprotein beta-1,6-N-acetylglucosaminyltransferase-like [Tubulanus polymorphus]|uniref:beta-1,3-galactosyl-O-glycosyl-glycoprotein beta-1,6-N-acetylglucosaminyltransferase-like n=1 Tax=Tubulanus polymorphus TaxID=672921 RepID=UPI003DA286AD
MRLGFHIRSLVKYSMLVASFILGFHFMSRMQPRRPSSGSLRFPDVHEENGFKHCRALFRKKDGATAEFWKRAEQRQTANRRSREVEQFLTNRCDKSSCETFIRERRYITDPITDEEAAFPIAFSILIYKDLERFERLLRMIYRPQNYYCVHVDAKSPGEFAAAVTDIAGCFPNVFLSSRRYDVRWGEISVLDADLRCMRDLLRVSKRWKYFINLTGQEAPLKTNYELVKILKIYNGANDVEGTIKRRNVQRFSYAKDHPVPINVTLVKGSVHITASRAFVEFVIGDKKAIQLRDWLSHARIPDEALFSTLQHNPQLGTPGAYTGPEHETDPVKLPFITRFKNWGSYPFAYPCPGGRRRRSICMLSIGDLPILSRRPELFANKFLPEHSPLAYDCLEELHFNHTRDDYAPTPASRRSYNFMVYESLPFVLHHT